MNEKNWREKVFMFGMIGMINYVILTLIAMVFYAGGTMINYNAPGYTFWANWFSDLGRTKGYSAPCAIGSEIAFQLERCYRHRPPGHRDPVLWQPIPAQE